MKLKFSQKFDNYASMAPSLCKNFAILVKILGKTESFISKEGIQFICKVKLGCSSFYLVMCNVKIQFLFIFCLMISIFEEVMALPLQGH